MTSMFMMMNMVAQEALESYDMEYFDKEFAIQASKPEPNGDFSFYIDCESTDATSSQISLIVKEKVLDDFRNVIDSARAVYTRWQSAAIENGITELDKEIKLDKVRLQAAFLYGSKWQLDFTISLKARFKVLNGKQLLILSNKTELQSSSNQFMKSDGFFFVFSNESEIQDFLGKLNRESVIAHFSEKGETDELFKQ